MRVLARNRLVAYFAVAAVVVGAAVAKRPK